MTILCSDREIIPYVFNNPLKNMDPAKVEKCQFVLNIWSTFIILIVKIEECEGWKTSNATKRIFFNMKWYDFCFLAGRQE